MRLFRFILVGVLLGGALWGFHVNAEKRMNSIAGRASLPRDHTRTLTAEEEERLATFLRRFYEVYGLSLEVEVHAAPCDSPSMNGAVPSGVLLLALCPEKSKAVLAGPATATALLGLPRVLYLRSLHFMPYFSRNDWPAGLAAALNLLDERLAETLNAAPPDTNK